MGFAGQVRLGRLRDVIKAAVIRVVALVGHGFCQLASGTALTAFLEAKHLERVLGHGRTTGRMAWGLHLREQLDDRSQRPELLDLALDGADDPLLHRLARPAVTSPWLEPGSKGEATATSVESASRQPWLRVPWSRLLAAEETRCFSGVLRQLVGADVHGEAQSVCEDLAVRSGEAQAEQASLLHVLHRGLGNAEADRVLAGHAEFLQRGSVPDGLVTVAVRIGELVHELWCHSWDILLLIRVSEEVLRAAPSKREQRSLHEGHLLGGLRRTQRSLRDSLELQARASGRRRHPHRVPREPAHQVVHAPPLRVGVVAIAQAAGEALPGVSVVPFATTKAVARSAALALVERESAVLKRAHKLRRRLRAADRDGLTAPKLQVLGAKLLVVDPQAPDEALHGLVLLRRRCRRNGAGIREAWQLASRLRRRWQTVSRLRRAIFVGIRRGSALGRRGYRGLLRLLALLGVHAVTTVLEHAREGVDARRTAR
eukprot:scaffold298_cov247-Pinguiococcus_pyrenoidosus.AAC.3